MEQQVYEAYAEESQGWLHEGRRLLISTLLSKYSVRPDAELLEVGAGVGQNIETLSGFGHVDALEINPIGLEALRWRSGVRRIYSTSIPSRLDYLYDVVGAFDVIEHLEDDRGALSWIFEQLRPRGIFLATVPAYQWLFSDHDRALGHYRRYTAARFRAALPPDAEILCDGYFNTFLFPAAVVARTLWQLKRSVGPKVAPAKQSMPRSLPVSWLFSKIMAWEIAAIQNGARLPYGLSYYVVAQRRSAK